jgi:hypothetical protein
LPLIISQAVAGVESMKPNPKLRFPFPVLPVEPQKEQKERQAQQTRENPMREYIKEIHHGAVVKS